MNPLRLTGLALCCSFVVVACASEPSVEELARAILVATNADPEVELTADQASCIAAELLASDLSDTTLSGLADNFDNPEVLETELDDVEPLVAAAAVTCR